MTTTTEADVFASAEPVSTADDLLGQLVAMQPIRVETIETTLGPREATITRLVLVHPDGTFDEMGERPIFWVVVRQQLTRATPEHPWIAGHLVQSGQAYKLDALTPEDALAVRTALTQLG